MFELKPRNMESGSFVCRVQYLNDLDPFMEYSVREPYKIVYHTFDITLPLSYQIAAVHRLLQAPHRVRTYSRLSPNACGEYNTNSHPRHRSRRKRSP
ncbi:hypothetical protein EVAR_100162_1 [Eumeta japonica]|uniref:FHOD1 N-terminal GTPase-binding domain-containing protein n=1 Tax=Eumeta variegata TaxID=151549 RepID=A0A4C1ZKI7_EUMVA|nr:hypothetical protein EVAR_100162_1 [Eumeta japonica]